MSDSSDHTARSSDLVEDSHQVTAAITRDLSGLLSNATYACGGYIKVEGTAGDQRVPESSSTAISNELGTTEPVTIRWDSPTSIEKLTLPLPSEHGGQTSEALAKLLENTDPAGFGYQGKNVVDETYRKASKLEASAFSTNFCPYTVGIIDVIGQTLLPKESIGTQGIRAELYKLNVYQGPSGLFKAHVDTPRSDLQFGSLVICLPCAHDGGQLVVRHQGQTMEFDWSKNTRDIQWAAFYSDCEHEVLEVTSGHRITLTYNLFARHGLGDLAGTASGSLLKQLPLYNEVKVALENPLFMTNGGVLGKYCSHAYAHSTAEGIDALPRVLKGIDMVVLTVFHALGMIAFIRPILDSSYEDSDDSTSDEECKLDWNIPRRAYVGHRLSEVDGLFDYDQEDCSMASIYAGWPHDKIRISWLNNPSKGKWATQFSYIRYGNQAELDWAYSHCALLFKIPSYEDRVKILSTFK